MENDPIDYIKMLLIHIAGRFYNGFYNATF